MHCDTLYSKITELHLSTFVIFVISRSSNLSKCCRKCTAFQRNEFYTLDIWALCMTPFPLLRITNTHKKEECGEEIITYMYTTRQKALPWKALWRRGTLQSCSLETNDKRRLYYFSYFSCTSAFSHFSFISSKEGCLGKKQKK